jgi:release factor glutamine methyltransferase
MTRQLEKKAAQLNDLAETSKTTVNEYSSLQTLDQWRVFLRSRLNPISETPGLGARVLLSHVLQQPQSWLFAHPEYPPNQKETHRLRQALDRLLDGVPLPYVIGQWEFFGLTFRLSTEVLIPRPETELLVETALKWLSAFPDRRRAIDLGTGSGCIAISLAKNCPDLALFATDISPEALATAQQNAHFHQVEDQIQFMEGPLWGPVDGQFDLICANLPYIPTETLQNLAVYGREPELALDGGRDGLDLIREFIKAAPKHLAAGGLLLAEIEASQGPAVLALAQDYFPLGPVDVLTDLAGRDRLLRVQKHL